MAEPVQVSEFRKIINGPLADFINASTSLGEPVTAMSHKVKHAFEIQLNFISVGVGQPRPDDPTFNHMIEPLSQVIREIQEFRDYNRRIEEFFNHLSTISESIMALSWISVKPAPVQFIRDMKDAGEYFGNRVLSTNKGNPKHITWIQIWNDILKNLEQYVKEYHLTGFSWGATAAARASGGPGLPPPPPPSGLPPPPPPTYDAMGGGDDRHALLNELNQGVDIVRMLRPVRREQASQSRAQPTTASTGTGTSPSRFPAAERVCPPKFFLEGRKWRVEHQKDDYSLTIENDDMSQSLAMFKCQNVGLEVRNKMNGVTLDNCKRSTVVLKDIIASVELIRCDGIKLQCSGHVPLISLDNCDSIQVFLTESSRDAEVISSKSSSLNICLLQPDGDYTELAVPEQIKTVVQDRRLLSTVVEKI